MMRTILVLFVTLVAVHAFPDGPPVEIGNLCQTMWPSHNYSAQTISPWFEIIVDKDCYEAGVKVKVAVQVVAGTAGHIEGLFVQARKAADPVNATMAYGTFSVTDNVLEALTCFSKPNSAVGHKSKEEAAIREFTWTAPNTDEGDLVMFGTVVHETEEFWIDLVSPVLSYNTSCVDNGASTMLATGLVVGLSLVSGALFR